MSKAISVKIRDEIFEEVEEITKKMKTSRNAYINQALKYFNQINRRRLLKDTFARESQIVRENSLEIMEEFERIEDDILE